MSARLMHRPFKQAFVDAMIAQVVKGFNVMRRAFKGLAQDMKRAAEAMAALTQTWKAVEA